MSHCSGPCSPFTCTRLHSPASPWEGRAGGSSTAEEGLQAVAGGFGSALAATLCPLLPFRPWEAPAKAVAPRQLLSRPGEFVQTLLRQMKF